MTASARAALLMLAATFSFAAIGALVRLASEELHAFEIVFFRNALALVALAPLLRGGVRMVLRTSRFDLHLGRAVISFAAMSCVFVALSLIPLAEVTAITFSAPLFATLGAVAVLGEVTGERALRALAERMR
ncbi:MAG: EamA family transporter, partial [Pseudomonadota bacterium]